MNLDHERHDPARHESVRHDSTRHNPDRYDIHPDDREREISLGTATILGIFLALALVCAGFFGFGYSLGRHSASAAAGADPKASSVPEAKSESPFSHFKSGTTPPAKSGDSDPDTADAHAPDAQTADSPAAPPPARKSAGTQAHPVVFPIAAQPPSAAADPPVASTGQFVVQVSAPSRQGDADALIAALNRKGYKAFIHKEPQDSFYHVQVGPYATKPDAQAMVKRLDGDGYKPFIK